MASDTGKGKKITTRSREQTQGLQETTTANRREEETGARRKEGSGG